MPRTWFKGKDFTVLEIEEFKSISKHQVIRSAVVKDISMIQSLMNRIQQIDPNGDMMVSWGPDAQYLTLTFKNEYDQDIIEVIQQKFKTPSTGFHGRNEQEASLYDSISALLD